MSSGSRIEFGADTPRPGLASAGANSATSAPPTGKTASALNGTKLAWYKPPNGAWQSRMPRKRVPLDPSPSEFAASLKSSGSITNALTLHGRTVPAEGSASHAFTTSHLTFW